MKYHIENGSRVFDATFEGDLTTVVVADTEYGVRARGYALRNLDDRYDQEVGWKIALSRAVQRLERKLEKAYIRALPKAREV